MDSQESAYLKNAGLPVIYVFSRIILYLYFFPLEIGLNGDVTHFYYNCSSLSGWPYIHYWMEYPPVFPFLMTAMNRLVSGQFYPFYFLITLFFAVVGAGALVVFAKLVERLYPPEAAYRRTLVLFALLMFTPHTWAYYDILPLLMILIALYFLISGQPARSGWMIGLGILTKTFPAFLLAAAWRYRSPKTALRITAAAIGLTALVYGALYVLSPRYTTISLLVQPQRNSWQTLWAMIDGNMSTGLLARPEQHYDTGILDRMPGRPARIPSWATLIVFGGLGLLAFLRVKNRSSRSLVAFFGLTWAVFLLWSPGWSPQWVLYLLPLVMLTLPLKHGLHISFALLFFTVLEWPFLIDLFPPSVWLTAGARALIFAWLGWQWYRITQEPEGPPIPAA